MKITRILASAALAVSAIGATANAQPVSYTTTGLFTGGAGCNTNVCTLANATLSFTGIANASVAPTFVSFGTFTGTATGSQSFAGVTFQLWLAQTVPTNVASTLMATGMMAGSYSPTSSNVTWTPLPLSFSAGLANYTLFTNQIGQVNIVEPSTVTGSGITTIQGSVSVVPEPSTYALMAAGLAAMAMVARRRRNTTA